MIPNLSETLAPLYQLTAALKKDKIKLIWTDEENKYFIEPRVKLASMTEMMPSDFSCTFILDSESTVEAIIIHSRNGKYKPMSFSLEILVEHSVHTLLSTKNHSPSNKSLTYIQISF